MQVRVRTADDIGFDGLDWWHNYMSVDCLRKCRLFFN